MLRSILWQQHHRGYDEVRRAIGQRDAMSKSSVRALRDHFLAWQCRIRQIAMRQDGGRPSPGMRPRVLDAIGPRIVAGADRAAGSARSGREHRLLPLPGDEASPTRAISTSARSVICRPTIFSSRRLSAIGLLAVLPEGSPVAAALIARRALHPRVRAVQPGLSLALRRARAQAGRRGPRRRDLA